MEIIQDVIKDTILILPFLFLMYILLEYLESKEINYSTYLKKYGPLFGAIFGMIPECSFSIISSVLFVEGHITLGTLLSIYIATSDEALPLLLMNPSKYQSLALLVIFKVMIGLMVGYLVDYIYSYKRPTMLIIPMNEEDHSIIKEAFIRTIKIFLYVFVLNILLSFLMNYIGPNNIKHYLMLHKYLQPLLCTILGFIPNCSISILLVELYNNSMIYFGSLLGGLVVNAGLGLFVLIQKKLDVKILLIIGLVLFVTGYFFAIFLNFINIF